MVSGVSFFQPSENNRECQRVPSVLVADMLTFTIIECTFTMEGARDLSPVKLLESFPVVFFVLLIEIQLCFGTALQEIPPASFSCFEHH